MEMNLAAGESVRLGDAITLTVVAVEDDLVLFELKEPGEVRLKDDEEADRRLLRRRLGRH
jgi:hypothetical protein